MRGVLILASTSLLLLMACPTASAGIDELTLTPAWPQPFEEAMEEPVALLPGPPMEDEYRPDGPPAPGATSAGTEQSLRLSLFNPDGSPGPAGDLELDPSRPIVFEVYLSADATPGPAVGPLGSDHGLAVALTIETTLTLDGQRYGPANQTHTLVSTPAHDAITSYRFAFDVPDRRLPQGGGLHLDMRIYQANASGEQLTQGSWKVHTTPEHPTGIGLPLLEDGNRPSQDATTSLAGEQASVQQVRKTAMATLAGSLLVAAAAGHRLLRS